MTKLARHCVVAASIICVGVTAVSTLSRTRGDVRTEDRNGDGRPDVWRAYDSRGQLVQVTLDTNFDGRSDVREYYEGSHLVRRESDRDFNDRIDLVEEFDPKTRDHVRTVVDVDFDGVADLLVLFQGGQPVFSSFTPGTPGTPSNALARSTRAADEAFGPGERLDGDLLAPLIDPFRTDRTLGRAGSLSASYPSVGLASSGGLPRAPLAGVRPVISSTALHDDATRRDVPALRLLRSPRGPPLSIL